MKLLEYLKLIRVYQWYKNLVIFLPIFFIGALFNKEILIDTAIGFFALSLISSFNYVVNDIVDISKDKLHPEKKNRPLASGKVKIYEAIIIAIILLGIGGFISFNLGYLFFICALALLVLTSLYSFTFKDEPILDIVLIATNFVIRVISGAFLIQNINISPWLILCPFFLALFLAVAKRDADSKMLKKDAKTHKKVLTFYTPEITKNLMNISATCLIMSYSLYSLTKTGLMLITIPFFIYLIFRYYTLVQQGSEVARNPFNAYKDIRLVITAIILVIITFIIYYLVQNNIHILQW